MPAVERARLASGEPGGTGETGGTADPGDPGGTAEPPDPGGTEEPGGRLSMESVIEDSVIERQLLGVGSGAAG
jgi:hypothetical protein